MGSNYTEELEKRCDELQEELTQSSTILHKFFHIEMCLFDNKISVNLKINMPTFKDPKEFTHQLCTGVLTNVDDVRRWFLEFCDNDKAYVDLPTTPGDIVKIIVCKFGLGPIQQTTIYEGTTQGYIFLHQRELYEKLYI